MGAASRLVRQTKGMVTILRHMPSQRRAPFQPREELERRRDRAVRETVHYAACHVPYYRDLFRQEGIDPLEIRSAGDLARLPVVSRSDVVAEPSRYRADAAVVQAGVMLRSSGTTGTPLELYHDRRSVLLNVAHSERERAVEAALVGKRLRYTRLYLITDAVENVRRVRGLTAQESFRPFRPRYLVEPYNRPREELLSTLDRIRPDVVMGAGSVLEAFFRVAAARGGLRSLPKVVLYAWDAMTAAGRELIERTFGIPVLSRYSAMESLKIGFFCEEGSGFHLHEDLCHVEARRPDGSPAAPGEVGELVISNLVNRGSVLLNYRIGDRGALSDDPCPCGRNTRRILELDGRTEDVIVLPDGSLIGAIGISGALAGLPGLLRFRLVQRGATEFDVELVPVDPHTFARLAEQAVTALRPLLPGCDVRPVNCVELELPTGGKHRYLIPLERD